MAAANLIERFEEKLEAKLDARNAKFDSLFGSLRWMLRAVLALLAALTALGFANWLSPLPAPSVPQVVLLPPTPAPVTSIAPAEGEAPQAAPWPSGAVNLDWPAVRPLLFGTRRTFPIRPVPADATSGEAGRNHVLSASA